MQGYRKEPVSYDKQPAGSSQTEQHPEQQEVQRPSAYHESSIKKKEPVLHRKAAVPFRIKRADGFSLKERRRRTEKVQEQKPAGVTKRYRGKRTGEFQQKKIAGNNPVGDASEKSLSDSNTQFSPDFSADGNAQSFPVSAADEYARSFSDERNEQISRYKRKKFSGAGKQGYSQQKLKGNNTNGKTGIEKNTGASNIPKSYPMEVQPLQMQDTGQPALLQVKNNFPVNDADITHIKKRNAKDSIRQRDGEIPGRKDKTGRENKKEKKDKKNKRKEKDAKKDNSHSRGKNRKDRAAALRLLSYASDKFSTEEQKDSLLKVAKDFLTGKVKAVTANALLSMGAALLPALIPAVVIVLIITLLFNSPFSILLPKLSEEPGVVEILAEYTEEFREKVEEELADPGSGDETELIYEDYEGDGEPDNMADILMVYMVKHGFGDTATVMTQKNKTALKNTFDEMTSLNITYRTEIVEESYEEEDFYGNVTVRTEEVEIRIKEVRVTLLTSEDIISTGIFTEEETEILRYLMSPEVLENIEGLTGGYGSPGAGSLTPEEMEHLNLGGDIGSQAVKNALAKLGKPYSQAMRDSGDYYDCSSLTYYAYKEAGITLSYHGSNTAASQGQLLADRGCEVAYEDIQPGDLIFYSFTRNGRYKNISHVAVYAGNGYLVDASSSKGCVVFRPVYSTGKIVMCGRPSWL